MKNWRAAMDAITSNQQEWAAYLQVPYAHLNN
jgi:hypothetical protein